MEEKILAIFLPEQENKSWEKRIPHVINTVSSRELEEKKDNKNEVSEINKKDVTSNTSLKRENNPFLNLSYVERFIYWKIEESLDIHSTSERVAFLKKLKLLKKEIESHKNYYNNNEKFAQCLELLNELYSTMENKKQLQLINPGTLLKTQKGMEIEKQLNKIKQEIKTNVLCEEDRISLLSKLKDIRSDIELHIKVFSKNDNIPGKLEQIEQYFSKLQNRNISNTNNKAINQILEGPTKRGREIQEELAKLRDETKRKDLNPIEKEYLSKQLLALQKEMISENDKFSKFDSIPVRLDQVQNYLEKLRDKKQNIPKSPSFTEKKDKEEINKVTSKKQKKQIIWKFGL